MSDPIAEFCAFYHEYNDISEQRRKMQLRVLREFERRLPGPVADVTADQLQAFMASLVANGLHPNTVRQYLNAIRPLLTWMWNRKLISADTLLELRAVRAPRGATGESKPRPYTRKELARFWGELERAYPRRPDIDKFVKRWRNGTSKWNRVQAHAKRLQIEAIIALALYGGLRRDEIFNLALEELDPGNEYIVVRSARKNPSAEQRVRGVPWMSEDMKAAVERWLEFRELLAPAHDRPWLSLHQSHRLKAMRHRQFEMLMRNIGRGWEYHRMRHTAITTMVRAGVPIERVMKIAGHARLQQTMAYTKIEHGDVVLAARRVQGIYGRAFGREAA